MKTTKKRILLIIFLSPLIIITFKYTIIPILLIISFILFALGFKLSFEKKEIKITLKESIKFSLIEKGFFYLPLKTNYFLITTLIKKPFKKTIPIRINIIISEFLTAGILSIPILLFLNFDTKLILALLIISIIITLLFTIITKLMITTIILLIAWAVEGLIIYFLGNLFSTNINPLFAIAAASSSIIIGVLTTIPGGIGATEGSLTALLIHYGILPSKAILLILIFRILTLWIPFIIGQIIIVKIGTKKIKNILQSKNLKNYKLFSH